MKKTIAIALITLFGLAGCQMGGNAGDTPLVPIPSPPIARNYPIDIDFGGLPNGPITGIEIIDDVVVEGDDAYVGNGTIEINPGSVSFVPPDPVEQVSVMLRDSSQSSKIVGLDANNENVCTKYTYMPDDFYFYSCTAVTGKISQVEVSGPNSTVMRAIFSMPYDFILFEETDEVAMAGSATDILVGRIDGDEFTDFAVLSPYTWTIHVAYGNGEGGVSRDEIIPTSGASFRVIHTDLDGDTLPELIASQRDNNAVRVFNNLDGTFGLGTAYPAGTAPVALSAGQIDGLNGPDLAVAGSSGVFLLIDQGGGVFGPPQPVAAINEAASDVGLADMDLDGNIDMVVLLPGSDTIQVLLGDGAGGFAPHQSLYGGDSPEILGLQTLDWDRYPEAVATSVSEPNFNSWLNLKDGTLATLQSFQAIGGEPADMILADINADGFADVVIADGDSGQLAVFVSQLSMGQFQIAAIIENGPSPVAIGAGKLNGDNKVDILTVDYLGTVRVYLNTSY